LTGRSHNPEERRGVCVKWYQSLKSSSVLCVSGEKVNTMLPRRCAEPHVENRVVEREMRELRARLDAMETTQRRAPDVGDVSDAESEEIEVEEVAGEDAAEEHLLRVVVKLGAREKIDILMYEGNLDVEELLDWI
jgi:hypothetical protein